MRADWLGCLIVRSTSRYFNAQNGLEVSFAQHQGNLYLDVGVLGVAGPKVKTHCNDGQD